MPSARRPQRQLTDDWQQLRLLVTSLELETYELLRLIVLFGRPTDARSRSRVYDTLQRWVVEDLAGLADRARPAPAGAHVRPAGEGWQELLFDLAPATASG